MFEQPKKPAWRNLFISEIIQAGDDVTPPPLENQFFFPDMDTRVVLTWEVSQREWTQVISGLMYLIDNAYPDGAIATLEIFLRTVYNMDICQQLADCIENSSEVSLALSQWIALNTGGGETSAGSTDTTQEPLPTNQTSTDLIPDGWVCSDDNAYGMAKTIVEDIHSAAIGVINAIETITNPVELIAQFVDNVEIVSWFGSGLELAAWLQDELIVTYEAAWNNTATQDEFFCDLYCVIKENCTLSMDDVLAMYAARLPSQPSDLNDFNIILDWLIDLDLSVDLATVAIYHWVALQAMRFRSRFGWMSNGYRDFELTVRKASNDSDPDWTFCDPCTPVVNPVPTFVAPCFGGGVGGQNLTNLGGTRWRAESTNRAAVPDEAIMIGRDGGGAFQINNVVLSHPNQAAGYQLADTSCIVNPPPVLTDLLEFGYTWLNGSGLRAMEFDMLPPS